MSTTMIPPTAPPPARLWKVADVAAFLGVSESWVRLHVRQGDLPFCRVGGLLRFYASDIEAYARGAAVRIADVIPLRKAGYLTR
jgi:excisionase family DNA binding protein